MIYKHWWDLIAILWFTLSVAATLYGHVYTCSLAISFTCEPARRLPMASPPLQKKEVVASFRHPEFQGVFKENFLRVQPHFFQKGGTGREESQGCVVPCSGGPDNLSGRLSSGSGAAWSILTAARKRVSPWSSCPADSCRFRTSSPRFLTADFQQLYSNQIAYEVRCLTLMLRVSSTPLSPILRIIRFSSLKPN